MDLKKIADKINPFDDIHAWVEKKIKIAGLRARAFGLREAAEITYKGMMARADELDKEANELE